jgi:hypothetical protein
MLSYEELLIGLLFVSKAILVAQYLRSNAWWRLDSAGAGALEVAHSVVALLDAAAYLRDVPDDDPEIRALDAARCFSGGAFDPGHDGAAIIRGWQLATETSAGPRNLLTALARAAAAPAPAVPVPARGFDGANAAGRIPVRPAALPRPEPTITRA